MRRAFRIMPVLLFVALSGCGDGTATLSGTVTYKGRPVTSGSIIVLNGDGTARSGVIQPDATYTVAGVKLGRVKIGVLSPNSARLRDASKCIRRRVSFTPVTVAAGIVPVTASATHSLT